MALSDSAIRSAKPQDKPYKLYDEKGLFLLVATSGGKLWRFKYSYFGKEKTLSIGSYPEVSLKAARTRRDEARTLVADGLDPATDKKQKSIAAMIAAGNTFKLMAEEFIETEERKGLATRTNAKTRWLFSLIEADLGKRPITDIKPFEVLTALKKIERRGNYETALRARAFAARVFRYAIITGRAHFNPASELAAALVSPKVKHHAAILEPAKVGALMRAIDAFDGFITTKLALQLAPHVFVRPGELRQAEWTEFDFGASVWRIPAAKMKMRSPHMVPLSRQSLAILAELRAFSCHSKYLFPSIRTPLRPMSENTLNVALRRLGYGHEEMTAHGFRSTASTLLNESGKWHPDAIERALAHKDIDPVRSAYHRGTYWEERVRMAQWWSDYLDRLREGGEVLPFARMG